MYFADLSGITLQSQCDGVADSCKSTLDVLIFSAPAIDYSDPWLEEWSSEEKMCCTDATAAAGLCYGTDPHKLINPPGLFDSFKREITVTDGEIVSLDEVSENIVFILHSTCLFVVLSIMV